MSKSKFSLTVAPTFKAKVPMHIPGGKPMDVEFTFKARTADQFKEWGEQAREGKFENDVDAVLDIASGWELEDAWNRENIELLLQNYIGSARSIVDTYVSQLTSARLGN